MAPMADSPRLHRAVLLCAGLVVIAAGLRAAAPMVNLVLVSLLLAMTVYPIPHVLTRRGMPRSLAVLLTVLLVLVGGAVLVLVLAASLTRLADQAPSYGPRINALIDAVQGFLVERGIEAHTLPKPDAQRLLAWIQVFARAAVSALGNGFLVLILIALFLLELPLRQPGGGESAWSARMDDVGRGIRLFVGINGILGAGAAVLNFVVMLAVGTDFAVTWAVLSFLGAFVPFGFLISVIPPFAVTLLEHGSGRAFLLLVLFVGINLVADNVIKPKVMGQGLGISPLVIVLSLLAWMFVLGPAGALLAIPLTIAGVKILPLLVEGEGTSKP